MIAEWISVKERLPQYGELVLICSTKGVVQRVAYYRDGCDDEPDWWQDCLELEDYVEFDEVSHWMPLPEPPHA